MLENGGWVVCIVFCAALALGVFGALAFIRVGREDRTQILLSIADRWKAEVVRGDTFTRPRLLLTIEGVPGEVDFLPAMGDNREWMRIHFNWTPKSRLRVSPEGVGSALASMFGSNEIQLEDSRFDPLFWIEASDRAWALHVLTPRVRQGLRHLCGEGRWFYSNDVRLDIGPSGLVLRIIRPSMSSDRADLIRIIDLAILILTEARGTPGVALAEVASIQGSCPVCGHTVEGGTPCPSCRTPHHDDCWKYSGGCAIFACGGRARKAA
jgi:RING finger family protein